MSSPSARQGRSLRAATLGVPGLIAKGGADAGETVRVQDAAGRFLAWAAFSPSSMIRVRVWSFDEAERIDEAFFERRIACAGLARTAADSERRCAPDPRRGRRPAGADRRPLRRSALGAVLSAGTERWKAAISDLLLEATGCTRLYERSDSGVRKLEGLEPATGWLRGEGATEVTIREHGWKLTLDVAEGHKTGFYLDQRDNRKLFADTVKHFGLQRVLNCYCYTGGFSVAALAGGRSAWSAIDSSAPALARATGACRAQRLRCITPRGRAMPTSTRRCRRAQERRGVRRHRARPAQVRAQRRACRTPRGAWDINRLALRLLAPGGALFTFSCSGGVGPSCSRSSPARPWMPASTARSTRAWPLRPTTPQTLVFPEGESTSRAGDPEIVGRASEGSNFARETLKKAFTLRTLASCVNRRCTSAW